MFGRKVIEDPAVSRELKSIYIYINMGIYGMEEGLIEVEDDAFMKEKSECLEEREVRESYELLSGSH